MPGSLTEEEVKPVFEVDTPLVECSGEEKGVLGHPLVYLNMGEEGHIECPYCSRRFILVGFSFSGQ